MADDTMRDPSDCEQMLSDWAKMIQERAQSPPRVLAILRHAAEVTNDKEFRDLGIRCDDDMLSYLRGKSGFELNASLVILGISKLLYANVGGLASEVPAWEKTEAQAETANGQKWRELGVMKCELDGVELRRVKEHADSQYSGETVLQGNEGRELKLYQIPWTDDKEWQVAEDGFHIWEKIS